MNQATAIQPRVVIVGAGIAGLTCAYYLAEAGITAEVFEASTRLGGRVHSVRDEVGKGLITELGGEFIDASHRDVLRLVKLSALTLIDTATPQERHLREVFLIQGDIFGGKAMVEAFRPLARQIERDRQMLSEAVTCTSHTADDVRLDHVSLGEYLDRAHIDPKLRALIATSYTTEYGLDPGEQSAINLVSLISTDTSGCTIGLIGDDPGIERYKIAGGNAQLIEFLAERLNSEVHRGMRLESLAEKNGCYQLSFQADGAGNVEVRADFVVVTVPFSILRGIPMQVDLPPAQRLAIAKLRYGTNSKVVAGFSERPWRDLGYSGNFITDAAQTGWDSSRGQPGKEGSLTFYLGGSMGQAAGHEDAAFQASRLVPRLEPAFPGISAKRNGKAVRRHWPDDPFVLGSYSCFGPGDYTTIAGAFAQQKGRLLFAGEHISRDFQGYMNGGAETGRKAAEHIQRSVRRSQAT